MKRLLRKTNRRKKKIETVFGCGETPKEKEEER